MSKTNWEDNELQFARLLSEIVAATGVIQLNAIIEDCARSMDLHTDDVRGLIDRAELVWESAKG